MDAAIEIAQLRAQEADADAYNVASDQLIRQLLPHYACDFIVAPSVPDYAWVPLPRDFQTAGVGSPPLRMGLPPRQHRGPIALSLATLRAMVREL